MSPFNLVLSEIPLVRVIFVVCGSRQCQESSWIEQCASFMHVVGKIGPYIREVIPFSLFPFNKVLPASIGKLCDLAWFVVCEHGDRVQVDNLCQVASHCWRTVRTNQVWQVEEVLGRFDTWPSENVTINDTFKTRVVLPENFREKLGPLLGLV